MAGGALMQLVAFGVQDQYLVGNPTITYFKLVYKRHTNFACEDILQTGTGNPTWGGRQTFTISRNGDLLSRASLQIKFNPGEYQSFAAFQLIKEVDLEIGGQTIDTISGEWLKVYNELTVPEEKQQAIKDMSSDGTLTVTNTAPLMAFIDLPFFFSKSYGSALPLIALQYHEVKLSITYNPQATVAASGTPDFPMVNMYCNYVFLDSEERKRFASQSHEYLIEQVQHQDANVEGSTSAVRLTFNHPVKELITVMPTSGDPLQFKDFLSATDDEVLVLKLNGNERQKGRYKEYHSLWSPHIYHTRSSGQSNAQVVSFALHPEKHQPSGTCNFSRIDNAEIVFKPGIASGTTHHSGRVSIYAVSYNVLKILSGMGGLSYSN